MGDRYEKWLARDPDPDTRAELHDLLRAKDTTELDDRFAGRLVFGTAGLRGVLGAGPRRMNRLVVQETTLGLGAYILERIPDVQKRGVVIGYDGRRGSARFAADAAAAFAHLGIKAFLGDRVLPTPIAAYGIPALGAAAAVMVTASHNPPQYNGYKVYWENGAQIIPPHDAGIAAAIERVALAPLPPLNFEGARAAGLVESIGEDLEQRYLAAVEGLALRPKDGARATYPLAYTPLHGVGAPAVEEALRRAGFTAVTTVAEQREPDGAFPTVRFPNPEEPGAMDRVVAVATEIGAELALANDPDADRLAAAVRTPAGDYQMLSGNQIGILLGAEALERSPIQNKIVATTVVSSRMLGAMARAAGAVYLETLTGFKWISNAAMAEEKRGGGGFVFGYEEALGFTVGNLVRDKDGISSLVTFAAMAEAYHRQGVTLLDRLEQLYRAHGLYLTGQENLALSTAANAGPSAGDKLRASPPQQIAGRPVVSVADLQAGVRRQRDGAEERLELPASDVLIYTLEDNARVIVRPSGTEPKLKCYYEVVDRIDRDETLAVAHDRAQRSLDHLVAGHQQQLSVL